VLVDELKLPEKKRVRRYPNKNVLFHYAKQHWADWHIYENPEYVVEFWALLLDIVFSHCRIGEYIESSARRGSERGLYYKVSRPGKYGKSNLNFDIGYRDDLFLE
jgi:hypothetical protein